MNAVARTKAMMKRRTQTSKKHRNTAFTTSRSDTYRSMVWIRAKNAVSVRMHPNAA